MDPMAVIVTDSTCDLPENVLRSLGIECLPVGLQAGGRTWTVDGDELSDPVVRSLLVRGAEVRAIPPSVEDFGRLYRDLLGRHDRVLSLHVGAGLSPTVQNARKAASLFPAGQVLVVDSGLTSTPLGCVVVLAARAVCDGLTVPEAVSLVQRALAEQVTEFTVMSLAYMRRGGFIRRSQEVMSNVLNLRPVLSFESGTITSVREGPAGDLPWNMVRSLEAAFGDESVDVLLSHTVMPGRQIEVLRDLVTGSDLNIRCLELRRMGPMISAFTGPSAYGVTALPSRLCGPSCP